MCGEGLAVDGSGDITLGTLLGLGSDMGALGYLVGSVVAGILGTLLG